MSLRGQVGTAATYSVADILPASLSHWISTFAYAIRLGQKLMVRIANSIREELLNVRRKVPLQPGPLGTGVDQSSGQDADRPQKEDFAQQLSDQLAIKIANGLRPAFPGILPMAGDGKPGNNRGPN